jgi:hypothetical protein
MRTLVLTLAIISVTACGGGRSLGGKFSKMGRKLGDIAVKVKPVTPPVPPVTIDAAVDVAGGVVADRVAQATPQPVVVGKKVHRTQGTPPAPTKAPRVVADRRSTAPAAEAIWKNISTPGARPTCTKVAGAFDSCSAECGAFLRDQSMKQLAKGAGAPSTCECTQGYSHCK